MIPFFLLISFMVFANQRTLSYLHIYQQDEYDSQRFFAWMKSTKSFDKRLSIVILLVSLLAFVPQLEEFIGFALVLVFLFFAWIENNPLNDAKKPLVLTARVKRILAVSLPCTFLLSLIPALMVNNILLSWILPLQMIPVTLAFATGLLAPYELKNNTKYRNQALQKLNRINPYIIGVTGSFGKTSVKHILHHVLQNYAPTLITPGSVNTEMGIIRIIREQLKEQHKYFVVEMGAYGIGSIARLCELTPPRLSVITAIGAAHFERFKSLNDTARAKFEIADATIKNSGMVVVAEDVLEQTYAMNYFIRDRENFIVCGPTGPLKVQHAEQDKDGLKIDFTWKDEAFSARVPLYGLHHVTNVMLAFAVAVEIGMAPKDVVLTLASMPQIKHRLEVKQVSNYTIIDDAYNSNPTGFRMALDVLALLGQESGGRRILITPGMVELGEQHDAEHAAIGELAAARADIVVIVKPGRIPTFRDAFVKHKTREQQVIEVNSFREAQAWLLGVVKAGDVVLLENDLPDLYERKFVA